MTVVTSYDMMTCTRPCGKAYIYDLCTLSGLAHAWIPWTSIHAARMVHHPSGLAVVVWLSVWSKWYHGELEMEQQDGARTLQAPPVVAASVGG